MNMEADAKLVSALVRGVSILRCFSSKRQELSARELMELTGLPKPTLFRLTETLCELGLLRFSERLSKYVPALGLLQLSSPVLARMALRQFGWLQAAGARWGLDAAHRGQHQAPVDDAFTWQFALDRLPLTASDPILQDMEQACATEMLQLTVRDEWPLLSQITRDNTPVMPRRDQLQTLAHLLDTKVILNYRNGRDWYDIHPSLWKAMDDFASTSTGAAQ